MRVVKANHSVDWILHTILLILSYLVAGCLSESNPLLDDIPLQSLFSVGYTYQRSDGNRIASGRGTLPVIDPVDVPLSGQPEWLVAASRYDGSSIWVTVLSDGRVQAFQVIEKQVNPVEIMPDSLPQGTPPLLVIEPNGEPKLANMIDASASDLSPPAILNKATGRIVYIDGNGDLVIQDDASSDRLEINALPDARILSDEAERVLLLTDPTARYRHGVLGDAVEASSITLVETKPTPRVLLKIPISAPEVVEGLSPIWFDLTGDGKREIIVTLSSASQGSRIVVFDESGELVASGPPIDQGFRWRHQLAAVGSGGSKKPQIVSVRTPHIGGVFELYQLDGDVLTIVDQMPGYSSHIIGSRNLDMSALGDFDGDGEIETLVPIQEMDSLGAMSFSGGNVQEIWRVPVGGRLHTNLATVELPNGQMAVGIGNDRQQLRLWLP
jgi:hypothetical protein